MGDVVMNGEKLKFVGVEKEEERIKELKGLMKWEKFLPKMVLRVLLVEADDFVRQIISALLRKCCYKGGDSVQFWNVSREIRKILTQGASQFSIALDDVSITNLTFGREFTAAIEAKQVVAQEAEGVKFVVEKAKQDKRSVVIRAHILLKCVTNLLHIFLQPQTGAFTAGIFTEPSQQ
ncbi:hypothetical protein Lal_00037786 [Lupinus albus]|nr:hypothetical protein Lal_00037786 [Lupinus albus]